MIIGCVIMGRSAGLLDGDRGTDRWFAHQVRDAKGH
jgi:hypothetical protein